MSCGRQRLWRRGSDGRNLPFSSVRPLFLFAVHVSYKGKAAHASAFPWEGRNALDAAVACYNNISLLRQQLKPTWLVNGGISAFLAPGKPLFLPLAPENFFVPPPPCHVLHAQNNFLHTWKPFQVETGSPPHPRGDTDTLPDIACTPCTHTQPCTIRNLCFFCAKVFPVRFDGHANARLKQIIQCPLHTHKHIEFRLSPLL